MGFHDLSIRLVIDVRRDRLSPTKPCLDTADGYEDLLLQPRERSSVGLKNPIKERQGMENVPVFVGLDYHRRVASPSSTPANTGRGCHQPSASEGGGWTWDCLSHTSPPRPPLTESVMLRDRDQTVSDKSFG